MIRHVGQADTAAIRELSARVFGQFGDYGEFLPRYLDDPWVQTLVAAQEGVLQGFIMVGLTASPRCADGLVADILAIAVAPGQQGRGVGTVLMERGLRLATGLGSRYGVAQVELSVADTNPGAQRFFRRHGFVVVDGAEGHYPAGQVAIRMARPLPPPAGLPARVA